MSKEAFLLTFITSSVFLTPIDRYCAFTERNPVHTLNAISINILYAFFDRLLKIWKDQIGGVGTLQTYWNVFCQVQKKVTGCMQIDPLIKSQMHGVRGSSFFLWDCSWWDPGPTTTRHQPWVKHGEEEEAYHADGRQVWASQNTAYLGRDDF